MRKQRSEFKTAEMAGNHWAEPGKGGHHADRELQKSVCESPKNLAEGWCDG